MTATDETGFIGLGRMGRGMALNLAKSVDGLRVFDSASEALRVLEEAGGIACASPADMAKQCKLVFLCLPNADPVREVIFGPQGLQSGMGDELTIIDTTTLDRTEAIAIEGEAADVGIAYRDCPVSGMPFRAENGTLTTMFGGPRDEFDRVASTLRAFGEDVIYAGPLGSGQAMKAINNIIYNVNIAALCEVLPLAVAVGLDPEEVGRLVTSASSRSFASDYFVPRMLERRFDTDFSMEDAYKDIVNVQRMGVETRASLPVVNAMVATYQAALAADLGDQPKSAMLKVYEKALGVRFASAGQDDADD